jgi:hypothetical protein
VSKNEPDRQSQYEATIVALKEFVMQQVAIYIQNVQKEATTYNQKIR